MITQAGECGQVLPHQPHIWPGPGVALIYYCEGIKRHKHSLVIHRRTIYTITFACSPGPDADPDWACNYTTRYDKKWVRALVSGETTDPEMTWLTHQEVDRTRALAEAMRQAWSRLRGY